MDSIIAYLDQPITPREFILSPLLWMTIFCGFLLYKLCYRSEPQISQRAQKQHGGAGNSQNMSETHKFGSDNKMYGPQNVFNKSSKIKTQNNVQGDTSFTYDKFNDH